ncbi:MAG: PAS domain S-box protein [Elusimicrobiota bacterium]
MNSTALHEKLITSEIRYRRLFEAAKDGILILDASTGKIIDINPYLIKMLEYTKEELLGKNLWELGLFKNTVASKVSFKKLQDKEYIRYDNLPLETKNGKRLEFEFVSNVYQEGDRKVIQCNIRDNSERKLAEKSRITLQQQQLLLKNNEAEQLKAYNRQLSLQNAILDSIINSAARTLIIALDKHYCYMAFNKNHRLEMKKVYNAEIEIGKSMLDYISIPITRSAAKISFDRVLNGESFVEQQFQPNTGSYYEFNWNPINSQDGKVVGINLFVNDISERKKTENELKQSEAKYRNIFEQSNNAIIIADVDTGIILDANQSAEILLGRNKQEIIGMNRSLIHPLNEKEIYEKQFRDHVEKEKISYDEAIIVRKNGTQSLVQINASIIELKGKKVIQGIFQDITEHKRMEEEKEKLTYQLLQSQKIESIGILAGGIAHDFNNLLTTIKGYSDLIKSSINETNPINADVNEIIKASSRAADLTRQLLLYSRKQPMNVINLNVNRIIENIAKMLKRIIGEDIRVQMDLVPDLWDISADESQIEQIIVNLTNNARDAMAIGGILTVKTENIILDKEQAMPIIDAYPGRFIRFSFQDSGIGIGENVLPHIFEPFYTTKDVGKGTGLGLSVVYGIVKQHKGWINVCSESGKGTIFKIYLPKSSATLGVEVTKETTKYQDVKGHGERILVVEDEEGISKMVKRFLSSNGYIVFIAKTVKEALEVYKTEKGNFNLVISDVILPDKTGLELVTQLLLDNPKLKIILSSGYLDDKSEWKMIQKKGYKYIQKPFELKQLLVAVKEVLGK